MTINNRFGNLLAIFVLGGGLVACTTQEAKTDGGGHGGGGGSTGNGGASGTGGGGPAAACGVGNFAPLAGTVCPLPTQTTITDFTYSADSGATDQVRFGDGTTTFSGGESVYANAPGTFTSDVTGNDWHIMINVANFSGFGLYFDNIGGCNMVDASAYAGITFTIWGDTAGNTITMGMGIVDDSITPSWLASVDGGASTTPGSCIPTSGNGMYYHPGCADPTNVITLTGTQPAPQTVSLTWADFTGGACKANVEPNQILSLYWQMPWTATATPYTVDLHIDNIAFIPK
jgi:hypothetical protein